ITTDGYQYLETTFTNEIAERFYKIDIIFNDENYFVVLLDRFPVIRYRFRDNRTDISDFFRSRFQGGVGFYRVGNPAGIIGRNLYGLIRFSGWNADSKFSSFTLFTF